ncbi:MAG: tRNA pseudouridine(38-40) synthase TruA [Myxococcales bacterium]|nr:tRNA pseudouridine(38-40) synthase TruA [Myxococcales bacterium]
MVLAPAAAAGGTALAKARPDVAPTARPHCRGRTGGSRDPRGPRRPAQRRRGQHGAAAAVGVEPEQLRRADPDLPEEVLQPGPVRLRQERHRSALSDPLHVADRADQRGGAAARDLGRPGLPERQPPDHPRQLREARADRRSRRADPDRRARVLGEHAAVPEAHHLRGGRPRRRALGGDRDLRRGLGRGQPGPADGRRRSAAAAGADHGDPGPARERHHARVGRADRSSRRHRLLPGAVRQGGRLAGPHHADPQRAVPDHAHAVRRRHRSCAPGRDDQERHRRADRDPAGGAVPAEQQLRVRAVHGRQLDQPRGPRERPGLLGRAAVGRRRRQRRGRLRRPADHPAAGDRLLGGAQQRGPLRPGRLLRRPGRHHRRPRRGRAGHARDPDRRPAPAPPRPPPRGPDHAGAGAGADDRLGPGELLAVLAGRPGRRDRARRGDLGARDPAGAVPPVDRRQVRLEPWALRPHVPQGQRAVRGRSPPGLEPGPRPARGRRHRRLLLELGAGVGGRVAAERSDAPARQQEPDAPVDRPDRAHRDLPGDDHRRRARRADRAVRPRRRRLRRLVDQEPGRRAVDAHELRHLLRQGHRRDDRPGRRGRPRRPRRAHRRGRRDLDAQLRARPRRLLRRGRAGLGRRVRQRHQALGRRHHLVRRHQLRVLSDADDRPSAGARQVRLTVEYDGAEFGGWQRQNNAPTVQGHLEAALAQLLTTPTPVRGASRTDAGVHALGQVASFRTDKTIPVQGIRRGLNALLPPAIAVLEAQDVDLDFHPRFHASGKHYRYVVLARPDRSPRWRNWAWHRRAPLDVAAMTAAAADFVGEHDFAALRAVGCAARTTRRHITQVTLAQPEPGLIAVDVHGNAFLRNMVRILVGTLVEIGEGRRPATDVPEILASLDRARAGQTAPPQGLTLVEVRYDGTRVSSRPHSR